MYIHFFEERWTATLADFSQPKYDRNWLYLGIGERFNSKGSIELAYLPQNIAKPAEQYERHPIVQLSFHYLLGNKSRKS